MRATHVSFPYNRDMGELPLRGVPNVHTNPHLDRDIPEPKRQKLGPLPEDDRDPVQMPVKTNNIYFTPGKNINEPSHGRIPKSDPETYRWMSEMAYSTNDNATLDQLARQKGWYLDTTLSTPEAKIFTNPETRVATIAYRGTVPTHLKDLKSDLAILTGQEKSDTRFQEALRTFDSVQAKLGRQYAIDTTGHSLGGQLATHVNREREGQVRENISFSRGTGLREPFRTPLQNTWDYSNWWDPISQGARWSHGRERSRNHVDFKLQSPLGAHDVQGLSRITDPESEAQQQNYTPPNKAVETSSIDGIRIM